MSAVQVLSVKLQRADHTVPWGFNLQGGKDFECPLLIQKVNLHSLADKCSMRTGDYILRIGSVSVEHLTHNQARETIVRQGNNLEMTLLRGAPPRSEDYQTRFDFPQHQLMTPENVDRAPVLSPQVGVQLSNNKALLTQSYNSPMGLYSSQNIADTLVNTMKHMNDRDSTFDNRSNSSIPLSPTTSGSTSPVSSVRSINDYSDTMTSRLDTVTLATKYLYQPEKSFNVAPRPFYLKKKSYSEETRPVVVEAKTIEIKPVDEASSSEEAEKTDRTQSRKVSVLLKPNEDVPNYNGSMRRGSTKISGLSGRLLLKMIENEMDNKPLTMKDVEAEQLKMAQPQPYKSKSAGFSSPSKSVDAVMTSDANNNQITVQSVLAESTDNNAHLEKSSPAQTAASHRSQFLKQRASFDVSSSPSWKRGLASSPGHVGKLADPSKPSMAQSRSFKLLEQTLNDGVAEKDAVFEKFVTEKSQYRRCSIQTQLTIEEPMSSLRLENSEIRDPSQRKGSMPILNLSDRIEQLRKSSNNKNQRSNSEAFVPTAFQRSWLVQKSKDMNAIEESDTDDANHTLSSDL